MIQSNLISDNKRISGHGIFVIQMDNTSKFMNEALDNSVGTNRSDLGAYKKFALNLTNVVLN